MFNEKIRKIENSVCEARKFITIALMWQKRLSNDRIYSSKEGGAAKRASLNLTRSLSELRK